MKYAGQLIVLILLVTAFHITPVRADGSQPRGIKLDGTLGTAGELSLSGPNYEIKSQYGQQVGTNLFHSFEQFNLRSDESATFSGPASVQNIISRVTGEDASWIDGTLRSAIEGADLYLFNPSGIMFGPNASLDLSGSFHVSTADYLRMGESERFFAEPAASETLSVAAPTAFGFLDSDVAPISVEGKGEITQEEWKANPSGLHVLEDQAISLIGGEIRIENGVSYQTSDGAETVQPGDLSAPGGRITIVGVASPGEVMLSESAPDVSSFETLGNITVADNVLLDVSGSCSGSVFIRGGEFVLSDSAIHASTFGSQDGGSVDIQAETLLCEDGADISADTYGNGNAGNILLEASEILLSDGARVLTTAFGPGKGGDITIRAQDTLTLSGADCEGRSSMIGSASEPETDEDTDTDNGAVTLSAGETSEEAGTVAGDGGGITIEAGNLVLTDGGLIASASIAPEGKKGGQAGGIDIRVSGTVRLSGVNSYGENEDGFSSGIYARSRGVGDSAGDAGTISLEAGSLTIEDGAIISSNTSGFASGGNVSVRVTDSVRIEGGASGNPLKPPAASQLEYQETYGADITADVSSGIYAGSDGTAVESGQGGKIDITAGSVSLSDGARIASSSAGGGSAGVINVETQQLELSGQSLIASESRLGNSGGEAGVVTISAADTVFLSGESALTTDAKGASGGKITVSAGNKIYLNDSQITSSVRKGQEDGGDVTVCSDVLILNNGIIKANAEEGDGGAIFIATDTYIRSAGSQVTANSQRGNDGIVEVKAPKLDISHHLTVLPATYPDAARWAYTPCAARSDATSGRFLLRHRDAVPAVPDDWQPSLPLWLNKSENQDKYFFK